MDATLDKIQSFLNAILGWLHLRYPDLVVRAIHQRDYGDDAERDLFHWVHHELWAKPLVARAWVPKVATICTRGLMTTRKTTTNCFCSLHNTIRNIFGVLRSDSAMIRSL